MKVQGSLLNSTLLTFIALALGRLAQGAPAQCPTHASIQAEVLRQEYAFAPVSGEAGVWSAPNRGQGLRSRVSADGLELFPRTTNASQVEVPWRLGLRTRGLGRGEELHALESPTVSVVGARASLDHGSIQEWFENRPDGIEQGWTIERRAEGDEPLRIVLEVSGGFEVRIEDQGRSANFENEHVALPYRNLRAWDARERALPARLVERGRGLAIEIDDAGAVYPVTIDPTLAWMAVGGQANALFGFSVATAGDVNGDGYGDVIVGAVDYDNGQADEGRAYIYMGSFSGLATSPAWAEDSDQANADFGWSVATAGDVNGDGYGDVIVGARQFNSQGRAYVYLGSPTGLATIPAWTRNGLQAEAYFGQSVATAGDVNGDGYGDVIVGAPGIDNGQFDEGRAYVYLGSATGLGTSPGWTGESNQANALFGSSVATAGDVNGDGYNDVIVGVPEFNISGRADVYLGSASGLATSPGWTVESNQGGDFGSSVATAGDVNGDSYSDVIVGDMFFSNGQAGEGRAYVYLGSASGLSTIPAWIAESDEANAQFGESVATAGDVNGDTYSDVIVGAHNFNDYGRAYIYLGSGAGLSTSPAWTAETSTASGFGSSVATAGDVNGDSIGDVIVGAASFDNGETTTNEGGAFLYLGVPSLVLYHDKISQTNGGFGGTLANGDRFGYAAATIGDLDGDLVPDLAISAPDNEGGGTDRGGVWILFLNANRTVASELKIDDVTGNFGGALDDLDDFGAALAAPGDLDADGIPDLLVGAPGDDDGGSGRGAVWILYLNADGTVKAEAKISSTTGGFGGALDNGDEFGTSIAMLGNLDGAGGVDLAVGAPRDDDGGTDRGAVWILYLDTSEAVTAQAKISSTSGSFSGPLGNSDEFGEAVAALGDLDGVGGGDVALAVGAPGDDDSGTDAGRVWFLSLTTAGSVSSIPGVLRGAPSPGLQSGDRLGAAIVNLGRFNRTVASNLVIGAPGDDGAGSNAGAVWLASLDESGRLLGVEKLTGGFNGGLSADDLLGTGLVSLGDSDGDGRTDLVVSAHQDDDGGTDRGAVWIFYLNDGTLHLGATSTTWTGATDTQWALPSNWGNGVPDATKTAIIPDAATTPNDPRVTSSVEASNSLWIQSGGTLEIVGAADDLDVFGGATVSGPITGGGTLVFAAEGVLAGDSSIAVPDVRAQANLIFQGGPLNLTGTLTADASLDLESGLNLDIDTDLSVTGDVMLDGVLTVARDLTIGGTLNSSANTGGGLILEGQGGCVEATVGQVCFSGYVASTCSPLHIDSQLPASVFDLAAGWPASVSFEAPGTIDMLTPALVIGGDLTILPGTTLAIAVDASIDVNGATGIVVEAAGILDVAEQQLFVPAPTPITVRGKLNIGPGGELLLESNLLVIENGGTLCLAGSAASQANLSGSGSGHYTLDLQSGSTLAAAHFVFRRMAANGIVIGSSVALAPALDLREGLFELPAPGGVLLDLERSTPQIFRHLAFENGDGGAFNVRVPSTSAALIFSNWSGSFAGEAFDDDPADLLTWALPGGGLPGRIPGYRTPPLVAPDRAAPPPAPILVGPGGSYPSVGAALAALGDLESVELELLPGVHPCFALDGNGPRDLRISARAGAWIEATLGPVQVSGLAPERSLELDGLVIRSSGWHPGLVIDGCDGVVLLQGTSVKSPGPSPTLVLSRSRSVAFQGGAVGGELLLTSGSRATLGGTDVGSIALEGRSLLETRGSETKPRVSPGSTWLDHDTSPRLSLASGELVLESECRGPAWLFVSPRLGFDPLPSVSGVLLLERGSARVMGARPLVAGVAAWRLGSEDPGLRAQALVLDPVSGPSLSNVASIDD